MFTRGSNSIPIFREHFFSIYEIKIDKNGNLKTNVIQSYLYFPFDLKLIRKLDVDGEAHTSRYNEGSIEGLQLTPRHHIAEMFQGFQGNSQLVPMMPRGLASRTSVRRGLLKFIYDLRGFKGTLRI